MDRYETESARESRTLSVEPESKARAVVRHGVADLRRSAGARARPDKSAGPARPGRGSSLAGKVALVTGAARGIGRAIAVEFEPEHVTAKEAWDIRAPTVPLKVGWLQPDDISPAAVFLASDAANMVTSAEYEVTGGDSAKDI